MLCYEFRHSSYMMCANLKISNESHHKVIIFGGYFTVYLNLASTSDLTTKYNKSAFDEAPDQRAFVPAM